MLELFTLYEAPFFQLHDDSAALINANDDMHWDFSNCGLWTWNICWVTWAKLRVKRWKMLYEYLFSCCSLYSFYSLLHYSMVLFKRFNDSVWSKNAQKRQLLSNVWIINAPFIVLMHFIYIYLFSFLSKCISSSLFTRHEIHIDKYIYFSKVFLFSLFVSLSLGFIRHAFQCSKAKRQRRRFIYFDDIANLV